VRGERTRLYARRVWSLGGSGCTDILAVDMGSLARGPVAHASAMGQHVRRASSALASGPT
jgi:hypothetical protein